MKKVKILMILLASTVIGLLPGCKKDVQIHDAKNTLKQAQHHTALSSETLGLDDLTYYQFGVDILEEDFLDNPEDQADEDFNHVEYAMTLCLLELYNTPDIMDDLIAKMNSMEGKCYNLYTFAIDHPAINATFNTIFENRFTDFNSGQNWQDYVAANYHYDITYVPFIRFMNLRAEEEINTSLDILIAGAFEINEEKFTQFDNNYPVWIPGSSGNLSFATLDDASLTLLDNPIISISNDEPGDENNKGKRFETIPNGDNQTSNKCNNPNHEHESISHKKFKMSDRMESTGKSEYLLKWVTTAGYNFSNQSWEDLGQPTLISRWCKVKVHKDDIGTLINLDEVMFDTKLYDSDPDHDHLCFEVNNFNQYATPRFLFAAYEFDSGKSKKKLGTFVVKNALGNPITVDLLGKKKYKSDQIGVAPDDNNGYNIIVEHPTQGSTYIATGKGEVHLKRHN